MIKPAVDDDFGVGFDADDEFAAEAVEPWDAGPGQGADPFASPEPDPYEAAPADAFATPSNERFEPLEAPPPERQVIEEPRMAPPMAAAAPALPPPSFAAAGGEAYAPRIAIHIFCDSQETADIAAAAAADRRLSRATTNIRTGGVSAAIEAYQNQPTPSLMMIESGEDPAALLAKLDRLAEVCDPGSKVVILGQANDIALYRELMKRGVSDYLVPPLQPLSLIQAVTTLYADPSAPFVGRSVAFIGSKGGVGSSTIAHNFGYALTEYMQSNAVIVDLDLPFGTAGLDFNQDPLQGVADALSQPDRLDPVLLDRMMVRCNERLSLFAAPATLDQDWDIGAEAFEEVALKIKTTAPFVIFDLPHGWSGWMRKMLLSSDDVVMVATPDLASLRNAKNIMDLVRAARPNDNPPRLVLNQTGVPGRPEIPVKDFGEALGVEPSLVLPFEPKLFGAAANHGQMIGEVQAKSKAAEGLNQLAMLISRREPPPQPKKSVLSGLFKK